MKTQKFLTLDWLVFERFSLVWYTRLAITVIVNFALLGYSVLRLSYSFCQLFYITSYSLKSLSEARKLGRAKSTLIPASQSESYLLRFETVRLVNWKFATLEFWLNKIILWKREFIAACFILIVPQVRYNYKLHLPIISLLA